MYRPKLTFQFWKRHANPTSVEHQLSSPMTYDRTRLAHVKQIGTNVPMEIAIPLLWKRLEPKVNKIPGGCWIWTGYINSWGYGEIGFRYTSWRVHRVAYWRFKGPIPPKMQVCHSCDTPACCNPDHLWLGTNKQNHMDARAKKRCRAQKITHCPRGHDYAEHGFIVEKTGWRQCKICNRGRLRLKAGWPEHLAFSMPVQPFGYTVNPLASGKRASHRLVKQLESEDSSQ